MVAVTKSFAAKVAAQIGADPDALYNILTQWQVHEGGNASYNPLNTTQPGGEDPNNPYYNTFGNGYHVRNYASEDAGARATAQTLLNGYYPTLLAGLRAGKVDASAAPEIRKWGTTGFANAVEKSGGVAGGSAGTQMHTGPGDAPAPGSGSLADLIGWAAGKGLFGGTQTPSGFVPKTSFNGGPGDIISQIAGLGKAAKDPQFGFDMSAKQLKAKRDALVKQMMDLQAAGKPIPESLSKQISEIDSVGAYYDGSYQQTDPADAARQQTDLLQALAQVYGTAVQAGNMKSDAAYKKLAMMLEQAPYLAPHEYAKGGENAFSAFGAMMPGYNQADYKTQRVELGDPNDITKAADDSFQAILDALLGGLSGGGGTANAQEEVPFAQDPGVPSGSPAPLQKEHTGIGAAVNAFLHDMGTYGTEGVKAEDSHPNLFGMTNPGFTQGAGRDTGNILGIGGTGGLRGISGGDIADFLTPPMFPAPSATWEAIKSPSVDSILSAILSGPPPIKSARKLAGLFH